MKSSFYWAKERKNNMDEQLREMVYRYLESKGYDVYDDDEGLHVTQENTTTGVIITFEIEA